MTIYQACIAAGIPVSNHASDLYIPDTAATRKMLVEHGLATIKRTPRRNYRGGDEYIALSTSVTTFRAEDGTPMLDVAFQYDPFWERKAASK